MIEYIRFFIKYRPGKYILLFLTMCLGALFELVGLSLFFPILIGEKSGGTLGIVSEVYSAVAPSDFVLTCLLVGAIFLIKFGLIVFQNFLIYTQSYELLYRLKEDLLKRFIGLDLTKYHSLRDGLVSNVFLREVEKVSLSLRYLLQMSVNILYACWYALFAIFVSWQILVSAMLIGLVVTIIQRVITRYIVAKSSVTVQYSEQGTNLIGQIITAFKYLKGSCRGAFMSSSYLSAARKYSTAMAQMNNANSIPKNTPELVGVFVITGLLIFNEVFLQNDVASVLFVGLLLYRLLGKLMSVQKSAQDFFVNSGSIDAILEFRSITEDYPTRTGTSRHQWSSLEVKAGELAVGGRTVLSGVNVTMFQGQVYGVLGMSGAGKSTFVNSICGLLNYSSGEVLLDGQPTVQSLFETGQVGYVSQEPIIIAGSCTENIVFGEEYDQEHLQQISNSLGLTGLLQKQLTSGGGNISGGQRQLVNLARELYKRPKLLILDEFTSGLDAASEKRAVRLIESLKKSMITVIVSHRLSTLAFTDSNFHIECGRLSAVGSIDVASQNVEGFSQLFSRKEKR